MNAMVSVIHWTAAAICAIVFAAMATAGVQDAIDAAQPKVVKLYGAGGLRGLEAYQSGFLISADGYILTVQSHVLDTDYITTVLRDGRRFEAKLVGANPELEVALLKIDATGLPFFDLNKAVKLDVGSRVLAFSNIFGVAVGDEPVTVQRGDVAAVATLEARRGVFETPYHGRVYVLDVTTNNSGAAGGALLTRRGELAGMLGKQLRNSLNNTWLNYSIPIAELRQSVNAIKTGKFAAATKDASRKKPPHPASLATIGITMVPNVLDRTPPFVDSIRAGSPAAKAGVRPDDLVVLVNERLVQTCQSLQEELDYIEYDEPVELTVLRGQDLHHFSLRANAADGNSSSNPRKKDKP